MRSASATLEGLDLPLHSVNTLIVGSGAAALSAALRLHELGQSDLVVATAAWGGGTSALAGSDKQTYYKPSLVSDDSPRKMAEDLFRGGCMHGDIALVEAQGSLPAFFNLVRLGVPFPHDRFGAWAGYRTDHERRARATSAGPFTSRLMFEALAGEVTRRGIPVLDRHQVVALLTATEADEKQVVGALALDLDRLQHAGYGLVLLNARNVVLGTGGPGGLYATSVYPRGQSGSTGMALEAGAVAHNLTEGQFGLASTAMRWNLSGSYQQVIPRYVSTDADGGDEQEFLNPFFPDPGRLATAVFLKGYQWPFDAGRVADHGSSLIDLLVFRETVTRNRRVWLDYSRSPSGFTLQSLAHEARAYLERSGAVAATPLERLERLNAPAIEVFRSRGIDLANERLELAVCAQHLNGGLAANIWWESDLRHLFPVGEVNGSHGVYRPGGAALNAGQVGGMRAATWIACKYSEPSRRDEAFMAAAGPSLREKLAFVRRAIDPSGANEHHMQTEKQRIQSRMSRFAAIVRDPAAMGQALAEAWEQYEALAESPSVRTAAELPQLFETLDLCLTHVFHLEAIAEYLERGGRSRGSFLVPDPKGVKACEGLEHAWRFGLNREGAFVEHKILELRLDEERCVRKTWVDVRPIPEEELWFEALWKDHREGRVIR